MLVKRRKLDLAQENIGLKFIIIRLILSSVGLLAFALFLAATVIFLRVFGFYI
jgi:hypothetical protein